MPTVTTVIVGVVLGFGVAPHRIESPNMAKFELYKDATGEYRWRLRSNNGTVIAIGGEGFILKAGAESAIDRVRLTASEAPISEYEHGRWLPIDAQGNVSTEPAPENPDEDDEGETGPPEVQL